MAFFRDHLAGLTDFEGREAPQPFWLWAFATVALWIVAGVASIGMYFTDMVSRIERFARDHPDQVTRTGGPGNYSTQVDGYHPELIPDFRLVLAVMAIMAVMTVVLLAAAMARRLHDGGRSGWWGVMPVPFLFGGLLLAIYLVSTFSEAVAGSSPESFFAMFALLGINNLIYVVTVVILIVFCCASSEKGPNRFGLRPVIAGEIVQ